MIALLLVVAAEEQKAQGDSPGSAGFQRHSAPGVRRVHSVGEN